MEDSFSLVVPGDPVAKQRPRKGRHGNFYTPAKTREAETKISVMALAEIKKQHYNGDHFDEEVLLEITFYCKNHRNIDVDNCAKLVMDALNGVAYKDDRQVIGLTATKFTSAAPHTLIRLRPRP